MRISRARQMWRTRAVTKFSKPGAHSFGNPCNTHIVVPQVIVGVFEAVVYDADADSPARVTHCIHGHDVQAQVGKVRAGAGVLLEAEEGDNSSKKRETHATHSYC